jgi:hypothetical protein
MGNVSHELWGMLDNCNDLFAGIYEESADGCEYESDDKEQREDCLRR